MGIRVCSKFCRALLCDLSSFPIILIGKRALVALLCFVFQVSCDCYCSVALPLGAVGWSAVCDSGIS